MERKGIIIKRVKKGGHGGGHGGSWKVAYADFVTAMMAFFLLLWLLSMTSPDKKAHLAQYFKTFSLFNKSGGESLVGASPPGQPGTGSAAIPEIVADDEIRGAGTGPAEGQGLYEKMSEEIEETLPEFKDQIMVSQFDGGVRIELVEKEGNPMFPSSGTELTPEGRRILKVITETIKETGAKIAVEGHTDARVYASGAHSNWELSTGRATAARREMEKNGLVPDRLVRIAGYAATLPLIKENAYDPKNRRISILLFNESAAAGPSAVSGKPQWESGAKAGQLKKRIPPRGMKQFDPVEQYLTGR